MMLPKRLPIRSQTMRSQTLQNRVETDLSPNFSEWAKIAQYQLMGRKLTNIQIEKFGTLPILELSFDHSFSGINNNNFGLKLRFENCDIISFHYDMPEKFINYHRNYRLYAQDFFIRVFSPGVDRLSNFELDNWKEYSGLKRYIFNPTIGPIKTYSLSSLENSENPTELKLYVYFNLNYSNKENACFIVNNPETVTFIRES